MKKIDNYGTITSLWDTAAGNDAILGSFINEAAGKLIGYQNGYWNNRQITDFYNYGLIEGQTNVGFVNDRNVSIVNDSNPLGQTVLTNLKNYGTIKGALDGIDNYYQIENIYNDSVATISGGDIGLYSWGSFPTIARIANIINDGSISGASRYGIYNDGPNVSITSITNKGSITGGLFGIYNDHGSIGTLTNGQGGNGASAETKALTYKGNLPSSYFIYVSSATHYGQTAFTSPAGSMTFGVAGGSNLANGTYKSVITGLTSLFVSATSVKSINGATWSFHLNGVSDNVWDLDVTGVVDNLVPVAPPPLASPSSDNTRTALAANAAALRNTLNARTTIIAGTMDYDCATFDAYGLCLSFQARYTATDSLNDGAGVLTTAYRLAPNLRLGGFIDYSVSRQDPTGVKFGDQRPVFGAFLGYGESLGLQAKISAAVNTGNVTITRSNSLPDTEPGSGKASLNTYAFAGELGWAVAVGGSTVATPYGGWRVTNASRGAYGEGKVVDVVDFPISYAVYSQRLTTATAGLRLRGQLSDQIGYQLGLGGEYDLAHNANNYTGTSAIPGLLSFDLPNGGSSNSFRAIGTAGLFYQIDKTQRLTSNVSVRGQAYSSQPAVSVVVGYQAAF